MGSKYIIDYNTLTFKKAKFSFKQFFSGFWWSIILTVVGGVLTGYFMFNTIKIPQQKRLEKENEIILQNISRINQQFEYFYKSLKKLEQNDKYIYRTVLGLKEIPEIYRQYNIGGTNIYSRFKNLPGEQLLTRTFIKADFLLHRLRISGESYKEITEILANHEKFLAAKPSILPIPRKSLKRIGPFGMRIHPVFHVRKMHTGIDLTASRGTPVYAAADGIVVRADAASKGYGKHIRIAHGFGYTTYYAHLSKILVKPGQKVKRGQLIGLVGSTGTATGPHLHYEVRINGKPVDPINFFFNDITEEQYEQMIKQAEALSMR